MATAKKLASGSWRCQVYSHTEELIQPDGTKKKKRIYKSFTCTTPGAKGKRECERMAAEWAAGKERRTETEDMLLSEAYDRYISLRSAVISPATLREYKRSAKKDLQGLMSCNISKLTQEMIQSAINEEALSHSPKSVRNMHGLLSAVLGVYRPDFILRTDLPNKVRPSIYVPTDKEVETLIKRVSGTQMEIPVLSAAFRPYAPFRNLCSHILLDRRKYCAYQSSYGPQRKSSVGRQKTRRAMPEIVISYFQILLSIK